MLAIIRKTILFASLGVLCAAETYKEQYRDQYHYSPEKNFMNDPNGMVYHNGVYHLFYQYNPEGNVWGNVSWGHATSPDLLHWTEQPIALDYRKDINGNPEEFFYSGSAVVDTENTSGFGTLEHPPLVAMYTSNYEKNMTLPSGKTVSYNQESQSIAYSLDEGLTWTTYDAQNPVILEPPQEYLTADSIQNFRDPFVFWYEKHWVMVAALPNEHMVLIYTSNNLKDWTHVSSFGPANAISGQWECPGLFPLPVDGQRNNVKWVLQLGTNPGGPYIGSGTQYFVGSFDGTTFTADADSVHAPGGAPPGSSIVEDWQDLTNWTATGDFVGITPVTGEDQVSNVLDTYFHGDANTGTITSKPFIIVESFLNFRIAGGYHPYNPSTYGTPNDTETSLNLKVNGKVVRSATGLNSGTLLWQGWDVTNFVNETAVFEIADFNTGAQGWGHIIVGEIIASESLAEDQKVNWVDLGPDYYASASYNGLPGYDRIAVGWASNWAYCQEQPTSHWRSSMSVMRKYSLATINSKITLVQEPWSLAPIEKIVYVNRWGTLPGSQVVLPVSGKTLDVMLSFDTIPTSDYSDQEDSIIRLLVRSNKDGSQATAIGYDASTQKLFIDRRNSGGDVNFHPVFPGIYTADLAPDAHGRVRIRVLVDWSLVEIYGGQGESVITAQIFPSNDNEYVSVKSTADVFKNISIKVREVASTWD